MHLLIATLEHAVVRCSCFESCKEVVCSYGPCVILYIHYNFLVIADPLLAKISQTQHVAYILNILFFTNEL